MKSTQKLVKVVTLTALLSPILGMHASAAVLVTNDDITGGNAYTFNVNYAEMAGSVETDEAELTDMGLLIEGSGTRYWMAGSNKKFASLSYHWDFSTSNYRPTNVDFSQRVTLFGSDPTLTVLSQWSTDGLAWTTFNTLTGDGQTIDSFTTTPVALSGSPTDVYYRINFASSNDFGPNSVQFNRLDNNASNPVSYAANFTVAAVPEPSTTLMFVVGAGLCASHFLRRRRAAGSSH